MATAVTPWEKHVSKWRDCHLCALCDQRDHIVFYRGDIPATVLLIGESPGDSENAIGLPFVGPAGQLLNKIIARAIPEGMTYGLSNLVCCFPAKAKALGDNEPSRKEIESCQPRLNELINICQPNLIVCVGKLATDWIDHSAGVKCIDVAHPAYILRCPLSQREMLIQKTIVQITNAVEELPPF